MVRNAGQGYFGGPGIGKRVGAVRRRMSLESNPSELKGRLERYSAEPAKEAVSLLAKALQIAAGKLEGQSGEEEKRPMRRLNGSQVWYSVSECAWRGMCPQRVF